MTTTIQGVDLATVAGMTEQARDNFHRARDLIARAVYWSQGTDIPFEDTITDEGAKIVARRREQVAEMEISLLGGLVYLLTVPQTHDGPCIIHADGQHDFFFRHERSAYHGGLIYHAAYEDGKPLPVGRWSIHT